MKIRIKILMFFIPVLLIYSTTYSQVVPSDGKWIEGKKYIPYKIKAKDTWTNLGVRSESSVKELQNINKGVLDLKIGQIIYLPTKSEKTGKPVNIPDQIEKQEVKNENIIYHIVKKQETLYHISQIYHQSIADIMKWNNLSSNTIAEGAQLIVSKNGKAPKDATQPAQAAKDNTTKQVTEVKKAPVAEPLKMETVSAIEHTNKDIKTETEIKTDLKNVDSLNASYSKESSTSAVDKITETGIATWINDQELNQNKFYALHRSAPIGTIIKVTNRMSNNSVFVKVVGVLPSTGDNDNIIIKITSAAAQRIGAIDQKFTAELSYGITK